MLDKWESPTPGYQCPASTATNCDPLGQPLPDLAAMGANPMRKDIFVEIGDTRADPGTSYGTGANQVTDSVGHSHLPLADVLNRVGTAFLNAPVSNPNSQPGIAVHFDVGDNHQTTPANPFIIPANLARGGEFIREKKCGTVVTATCNFPDWPGTVGWKTGFEALKNAPVSDPLGPLGGSSRRRRKTLASCRETADDDSTGRGRTSSTTSWSLTRLACQSLLIPDRSTPFP